jgi:hypothetical protein
MIVFFAAILSLLAVIYVPFLANLFHLERLSLRDFVFIGIAMLASLIWFEVLKLFKKID